VSTSADLGKSAGLVARRMTAHRLWGRPAASLDDVVRGLSAMQSQEFVPAKWALAQRADGVTVADVDAAFESGRLLRTHILRPTWHFVHAADIRWMLVASAPRVHRASAYYYRQSGLDDAVAADTRRVFEKTLGGGDHATRKELAAALATAGLPSAGVPFGHVLMRAELDGVLVSGAMRGKQHTYALLDARVPPAPTPSVDDALDELTRRYLAMHGPATLKDYCAWGSLTVTDARRTLDRLGVDVSSEEIDRRTYWSLADATTAPRRVACPSSPTVDLVQCYDEVLMGYSESRTILIPYDDVAALRPGWHSVLRDGALIGSWRFKVGTDGVDVEIDVSHELTEAERDSLTAAVQRFGVFFGRSATWH
jgi:hypothetical protein